MKYSLSERHHNAKEAIQKYGDAIFDLNGPIVQIKGYPHVYRVRLSKFGTQVLVAFYSIRKLDEIKMRVVMEKRLPNPAKTNLVFVDDKSELRRASKCSGGGA